MRSPALASLALAWGCSPGFLDDGEGRQAIRTAAFATWEWEEQAVAGVFLSNGDLPCALEPTEDASLAEQQQVELLAAACREDARHLLLEFKRPLTASWEGEYLGGGDLSERTVAGRYFAVNEAVLAAEDGLAREFRVTDATELALDADGTGWLDEPVRGRLTGTYDFPGVVQATFSAEACAVDDRVFRVLLSAGRLPCPME